MIRMGAARKGPGGQDRVVLDVQPGRGEAVQPGRALAGDVDTQGDMAAAGNSDLNRARPCSTPSRAAFPDSSTKLPHQKAGFAGVRTVT